MGIYEKSKLQDLLADPPVDAAKTKKFMDAVQKASPGITIDTLRKDCWNSGDVMQLNYVTNQLKIKLQDDLE